MRWFSILFLTIGLGLLTGAGMLWRNHMNFAAHAQRADGTVTDLVFHSSSKGGGTYAPTVEFEASGRVIHISGSGTNPPAFSRGEHVIVLYPPENPEAGRIDSFTENWLVILILGGIGLVFAAIGGGMIGAALRTGKTNRWLATNGLRVQARYEGVESGNMQVNGRDSYRLKCQWQHPVTQKVYIFHSARIWFDPAPFVKRESLDVLVDMDNPKRYEVDISFLPQAG